MKIKNIFKKLILIEIALFLLTIISLFFQSQDVFYFNEIQRVKSIGGMFDMIIIFLFFIVYPVTIYLLYNFKPYGKQLYSVLVLIGFMFIIIQGPVAYDGWILAIEVLGSLNAGAILVLLYFSPIGKEFVK